MSERRNCFLNFFSAIAGTYAVAVFGACRSLALCDIRSFNNMVVCVNSFFSVFCLCNCNRMSLITKNKVNVLAVYKGFVFFSVNRCCSCKCKRAVLVCAVPECKRAVTAVCRCCAFYVCMSCSLYYCCKNVSFNVFVKFNRTTNVIGIGKCYSCTLTPYYISSFVSSCLFIFVYTFAAIIIKTVFSYSCLFCIFRSNRIILYNFAFFVNNNCFAFYCSCNISRICKIFVTCGLNNFNVAYLLAALCAYGCFETVDCASGFNYLFCSVGMFSITFSAISFAVISTRLALRILPHLQT